MLLGIREHSQSWIMWIIVGLLILMFALWGIQSYLAPESDPAVATVNGEDLSLRQYQERVQRQRYRIQNMMGDQFDPSQVDDKELQKKVLESMVQEEVLVQTMRDHGMYISDVQLAEFIRSTETFLDNGEFSQAKYEATLRSQGYSPGSFEYNYRRILLMAQLSTGISESSLISPANVENVARLAQQTRSFSTLRIPASIEAEGVAVTDAQVAEYYEANQQRFTRPEQISVEYIVLSEDRIAEQVEVSEADLQARYDSQKELYRTEEERRASHILLRVPDPSDTGQLERAQAAMAKIRERIDNGESFAEIAKQESEDPGSASKGGDLGFFPRGVMDPAFEKAVFSMQPGEISEVVKTSFGLHLIRLDEIKAAQQKSLDEVRDVLLAEARKEAAAQLFANQADQFANVVFEIPDSLDVAAEDFNLQVKVSDLFSRDEGQGIASDDRVRNAAFSDDVRQGNNSEPLELPGGRIVALRLKEYLEPRQQSLDEVSGAIRQQLQEELAAEQSKLAGNKALQQLREGQDASAVAKGLGLVWSEPRTVTRTDQSVAAVVLRKLFKMPMLDGKPAYDGVADAQGDFVLVSLQAVNNNAVDKVPQQAKDSLQQSMRKAMGQEAFEDLVRSLQGAATVEEHLERLE